MASPPRCDQRLGDCVTRRIVLLAAIVPLALGECWECRVLGGTRPPVGVPPVRTGPAPHTRPLSLGV